MIDVVALSPRTYFVVDRASKLVGLLLVVAGLMGLVGPLSPVLAVVGLVVGVATIFVDVEEERS